MAQPSSVIIIIILKLVQVCQWNWRGLRADNIGLTADLPRLTNLEYRTGRKPYEVVGRRYYYNQPSIGIAELSNMYRSDRTPTILYFTSLPFYYISSFRKE